MSRGKVVGTFLLFFTLIIMGGYLFYAYTGGNALSRVVWHYFWRDVPNKKYSWQDFRERGATAGISGFYAWGNSERFYLWTLSGLKRFSHIPGISIYQHADVCGAMRELAAVGDKASGAIDAQQTITGDIERWQSLIKQENLVTVIAIDDEEGRNKVDKVWSYSGIYKILNKLDKDSCN